MKKLNFSNLQGKPLAREQMKQILGGYGGGGYDYCAGTYCDHPWTCGNGAYNTSSNCYAASSQCGGGVIRCV